MWQKDMEVYPDLKNNFTLHGQDTEFSGMKQKDVETNMKLASQSEMKLASKTVIYTRKSRNVLRNFSVMCLFINLAANQQCYAINADDLVVADTRLVGHAFWAASVSSIGSCAKTCIKLKMCASFNFRRSTTFCELNSETLDSYPSSGVKAAGMVYSDKHNWPPELDPDCHGHECELDEVCIPGLLAEQLKIPEYSPGCGYACMKMTGLKCPAPPDTRTTVSLAIGSTAVCPRGLVGNTAVCQANQTWSKEMETACEGNILNLALHNNTCTSTTECEAIVGVCENNRCVCAAGTTYHSEELKCLSADSPVFGTSAYTFHDMPKVNWTDAKDLCRDEGGYLLELDTVAEHEFINSTLVDMANSDTPVSQGHWWTGGNDIDKDDDFIWDNSGQTFSTTYADWLTGSDHDLVMMICRVRMKKARNPTQPRLRSEEKLRDPDVAFTFQAATNGNFAPLIV